MKLLGVGMFALVLAAGATGLMTTACSDSNLGTAQGDGGAGSCPANPPTVGTACFLSSTTSCTYESFAPGSGSNCECCGGSPTYQCDNGKWTELATANGGAAGAGAAPACPATLPEAGSACTSYGYGGCEPPEQVCSFTCEQGGSATATCNGSSWSISTTGDCSDDGGADAGDDGGDASDGG